jgi:hypothetical protein
MRELLLNELGSVSGGDIVPQYPASTTGPVPTVTLPKTYVPIPKPAAS